MHKQWIRSVGTWCLRVAGGACFLACGVAVAENIGGVASNVTSTFGNLAQLITAGSYVAGFAFGVGAIVKFKAHKDNPTTVPISQPIMLLFVAAALMFVPSVFKTTGGTLFGASGQQAGVSGISSF